MKKNIYSLLIIFFSSAIFINCTSQKAERNIKFEKHSNRPYVWVHVNQKGPFLFLLDMGAEGLGRIDSLLVAQLKIPLSGSTTNFDGVSSRIENLVKIKELEFGSIRFEQIDLLTRDYNRSNREFRIYGILGAGFFNNNVLSINYPKSSIKISNQNLQDLNKNDVLKYNEPFRVKLKINDASIDANIDTGSSLHFHFPKKLVEKLNLPYKETGKVIEARRAYTSFKLIEVVLEQEMILGNIVLRNQKIFISDRAQTVNIGSNFLKDFTVSFDQKNKLIKIEK